MKLKLLVIALILLINVGFAFTLLLSTFYQSEDENTSKFSTMINIFSDKLKRTDTDFTKIVQLLEQDEDIKNKTIMAFNPAYSFHTNSEFIYTDFAAGTQNDTVKDFITRENWSEYDRWMSGMTSIPPHMSQSEHIPDYLIYTFSDTVIDTDMTWYVDDQIFYIHSLLANPEDPNLPEFLEPIYYSHSGRDGIVVYKVNI